jgi:hypothetical protein
MENKVLIDLSVKYGLDSAQISELANMVYQSGVSSTDDKKFRRVATYICEMDLLGKPDEEIIEELRRKGFMKD